MNIMQLILLKKTYFKSLDKPKCVDLFFTNSPFSFQNTVSISSGLSDFHKMVVTVTKIKFKKNSYRDFLQAIQIF